MATAVDQKLLRQTKFPPEFNQKVDMKKVNVEVMKKWIAGKISEILKAEDDVVIELCFNLLEGSRFPDIKALQISLTGFLDKDTARFCKELWNLCLSAQSSPQGVPKELLEAKKLELLQEKIDAEKAAEVAKNRKDQEQSREQDLDAGWRPWKIPNKISISLAAPVAIPTSLTSSCVFLQINIGVTPFFAKSVPATSKTATITKPESDEVAVSQAKWKKI
ncbi:hypothetical protein A1O1_08331 [Capronia coronata CBS 617.96]|uniref:PWI domain-containing protein n=1 Tax=Capronia coronata CBS 617.96 TaxID=1182541 RepID=W9YCX6_9EURO|nr:uncharacterized protein A1O1_08331 [Capronia coronata CBS 617.96]EXJ80189.1 hypothetical protein A1O1_08331 [Capronia coronata CBS 617.96]